MLEIMWKELVRQVPALVVILLQAGLFLSFLKFAINKQERLWESYLGRLDTISGECHTQSANNTNSCVAAIERNTSAYEKNAALLIELAVLMKRTNGSK